MGVLGGEISGIRIKRIEEQIEFKNTILMENDELTFIIIGCAMKIHNTLGNGFREVIYQRCLAIN